MEHRLTRTEERLLCVLNACKSAGSEMGSEAWCERFGLTRHVLKVHMYNLRRKGVPVKGRRGGGGRYGRGYGGYFLEPAS